MLPHENRQTGVFLVLMSGYEQKDVMAFMLLVTVPQYNNAKSWYVPFQWIIICMFDIGIMPFYKINFHFFSDRCFPNQSIKKPLIMTSIQKLYLGRNSFITLRLQYYSSVRTAKTTCFKGQDNYLLDYCYCLANHTQANSLHQALLCIYYH